VFLKAHLLTYYGKGLPILFAPTEIQEVTLDYTLKLGDSLLINDISVTIPADCVYIFGWFQKRMYQHKCYVLVSAHD